MFNSASWYYNLGFASCIVYTLFFIALWTTKELQVHPLKLVMYITFCDCIVQMSYINFARICEFKLYKLFSWTFFFSQSPQAQYASIAILLQSGYALWFISLNMTFMFNSALCLDLILVLHSPFKSAEARTPKYFWFCSIVTVATWICTRPFFHILPYEDFLKLLDLILFVSVVVFMASALLSGIYATYKLT